MPQIQTRNPVLGRPLVEDLLGALSVVPGAALLVTPFVHLFTAGPATILPTTLPAEFTEAAFVGYVAKALALPLLGPVNIDANNLAAHNEVDFLAGAVVAPGEMILGYWVDEDAGVGVVMYMGEIFDAPIPIAFVGDYISLDVAFPAGYAFNLMPT